MLRILLPELAPSPQIALSESFRGGLRPGSHLGDSRYFLPGETVHVHRRGCGADTIHTLASIGNVLCLVP